MNCARIVLLALLAGTLVGCGPQEEPAVTAVDGAKAKLSSFRGKVVLLDFWATWCMPCRMAMPDNQRLYARYRDSGLAVLAISSEPADTITKFVAATRYTVPAYSDPQQNVFHRFGVTELPTVVILDREGRVVAQGVGLQQPDWLISNLRKAGLVIK